MKSLYLKWIIFALFALSLVACTTLVSHESRHRAPSALGAAELGSAEQIAQYKPASEMQKEFSKHFLTGHEYCQKFSDVIAKQKGFYVDVPVNYENPEQGMTSVFAYFIDGKFDPRRPTVIYFDGGSGFNSHADARWTKSFNELHFDQRGIACSRPSLLSQYMDGSYYSSSNNARDAEEIRKFLKIETLSVYGGSYGTIPATMYAHLFPAHTKALVLEGVMFSRHTLEDLRVINYYLKKMYNGLPEATKQAMLSYFSEEKSGALYQLTQLLTYSDDAYDVLARYLVQVFPSPDKIDRAKADHVFAPEYKEQLLVNDTLASVDAMNLVALTCKDHRRDYMTISLFYKSADKQIEFAPSQTPDPEHDECTQLNIPPEPNPYVGDQYPVTVPVTYFQGNWDGATLPKGAMQHWKKVPRGPKQLFVAVKGGHLCNFIALHDGEHPEAQSAQIETFEKALLGEMASPGDVTKMNLQNKVKWVHAAVP